MSLMFHTFHFFLLSKEKYVQSHKNNLIFNYTCTNIFGLTTTSGVLFSNCWSSLNPSYRHGSGDDPWDINCYWYDNCPADALATSPPSEQHFIASDQAKSRLSTYSSLLLLGAILSWLHSYTPNFCTDKFWSTSSNPHIPQTQPPWFLHVLLELDPLYSGNLSNNGNTCFQIHKKHHRHHICSKNTSTNVQNSKSFQFTSYSLTLLPSIQRKIASFSASPKEIATKPLPKSDHLYSTRQFNHDPVELAFHHDDRIFRPNQIWVQGYQRPLHFILLLQFLIHMHLGHNLKFPCNCS